MFTTVELKIAGRLQHFFWAWETITSDSYILQAVKGYKIEFIGSVGLHQSRLLWEIGFNAQECDIVDQEIVKLLLCSNPNMRMENLFLTFFFVERKILNLKCFKENVSKHHFKMESLQSAVRFMKPGCYMASVDLKYAYYFVPIYQSHQKFLTFSSHGEENCFSLPACLKAYLLSHVALPKYLNQYMLPLEELGMIMLGILMTNTCKETPKMSVFQM